MADILSTLRELRSLEQERTRAPLTPEKEARFAELQAALAQRFPPIATPPPSPARADEDAPFVNSTLNEEPTETRTGVLRSGAPVFDRRPPQPGQTPETPFNTPLPAPAPAAALPADFQEESTVLLEVDPEAVEVDPATSAAPADFLNSPLAAWGEGMPVPTRTVAWVRATDAADEVAAAPLDLSPQSPAPLEMATPEAGPSEVADAAVSGSPPPSWSEPESGSETASKPQDDGSPAPRAGSAGAAAFDRSPPSWAEPDLALTPIAAELAAPGSEATAWLTAQPIGEVATPDGGRAASDLAVSAFAQPPLLPPETPEAGGEPLALQYPVPEGTVAWEQLPAPELLGPLAVSPAAAARSSIADLAGSPADPFAAILSSPVPTALTAAGEPASDDQARWWRGGLDPVDAPVEAAAAALRGPPAAEGESPIPEPTPLSNVDDLLATAWSEAPGEAKLIPPVDVGANPLSRSPLKLQALAPPVADFAVPETDFAQTVAVFTPDRNSEKRPAHGSGLQEGSAVPPPDDAPAVWRPSLLAPRPVPQIDDLIPIDPSALDFDLSASSVPAPEEQLTAPTPVAPSDPRPPPAPVAPPRPAMRKPSAIQWTPAQLAEAGAPIPPGVVASTAAAAGRALVPPPLPAPPVEPPAKAPAEPPMTSKPAPATPLAPWRPGSPLALFDEDEPEANPTSPAPPVALPRVSPPLARPPSAAATPARPAPAAPPALPSTRIVGETRVVVHTLDGILKRGSLADSDLTAESINFVGPGGREVLATAALKAVFFQVPIGEPVPKPHGAPVSVLLNDGRELSGLTPDYVAGAPGFFLCPTDQRARTARIYIYAAAVKSLS